MIRFCDNEVCCILYDELERSKILKYFFQGHMDEIVCVIDAEGRFKGKISYYSLIHTDNVFEAVLEDYVMLNRDIWKKARMYFRNCQRKLNEYVLLPVVDENGRLLCFAYEDIDANREIRMLKELSEHPYALQFNNLYPQYQGVKIYGFNELSYFFAKYLKEHNILVQVFGDMWNNMFEGTGCSDLGTNCMKIFAEGVHSKSTDWIDNLLESVSGEFECIDIIYEENIKNGIFKDAIGDLHTFLELLQREEKIVIIGSGWESQNVYDFLLKHNIDICCFMDESYSKQTLKLFGKKILSSLDIRREYSSPVFIECNSEHSSWGFGGVDYWDYSGFDRNRKYFLIRDYVNINIGGLINILKHKKIVLAGDVYLSAYLSDFFCDHKITILGYLDIEQQDDRYNKIPVVSVDDFDENTVCLISCPEFYEPDQMEKQNERKRRFASYLKEKGWHDYSDYFSYTKIFLEIEKNKKNKYIIQEIIPKKIVLGSIDANNGNKFFIGVLDGHPSILMIHYSVLNTNLFWICMRLSMEKKQNILKLFWNIYETEGDWGDTLHNPKAFNEKMEQLLTLGEEFTSQELFVMLHISYMYMNGRNITKEELNEVIIYWEPHFVGTAIAEEFAKWLAAEELRCNIVNVIRDKIISNGGRVKWSVIYKGIKSTNAYHFSLNALPAESKEYQWCDRLIVKFEELKCSPLKVLAEICAKWDIKWSDTFLITTFNGKKDSYNNGERLVSDYDIRPVYNMNEKYLSEFDRIRMMIIYAPWQKKYGYPYLNISMFSRRQLQEMFLKPFRFESQVEFQDEKLEREFKIGLYQKIRYNLQMVRMLLMNSKS